MSIPSAIATAYAKILTFQGRATLREFWSFYIFQVILAGALAYWLYYKAGLEHVMPLIEGNTGVLVGAFILTQLPGLSLIVRRLHDSGRSAWWLLITAVPVFGALALFVLLIQPSDTVANRYDVAAPHGHSATAQQPVPVPVESRSQSDDVRALYSARIAGLNKNPGFSA
ncbi:MAG: DUF805 domain-containing protein [Dinoroseobacter sp.]|nr:DUF805 domain-containing protein [Dinoroseobacter sp.]